MIFKGCLPASTLALICTASGLLAWQKKSVQPTDSIEGPALYQNYCARCHGRDAKGAKASPHGSTVLGPDLTRYAARHGGKFDLVEIRKVIAGEKLVPGAHGQTKMPLWGAVFSEVTRDQDLGKVRIDNLARYLRDIQVK